MKKVIIFIMLFNSILFANNEIENWTITLAYTKNIINAQNFVKKYVMNTEEKIFIIKEKYNYRIVLGSFKTKKEAHLKYKSLPKQLLKIKPYTIKSKYNLKYPNKFKNVIQVIFSSKQKTEDEESLQKNDSDKIQVQTRQEKKFTKPVSKNHSKKNKQNMINKDSKYTIEIALQYSLVQHSGNFKMGDNGTSIDFENLGIDTQNAITPTLLLSRGNHTISSSYLISSGSDNKTSVNPLILENYTYSAGEKINTSFDTKWFQIGYRYKFNTISLGANIHNFAHTIQLSDTTNTTDIELDYLFPTINADMMHNLSDYKIQYGLSYGQSSEVKYTQAYSSFLIPFSFIDFSIGYEFRNLKVSDNLYNDTNKYHVINFEFHKTF